MISQQAVLDAMRDIFADVFMRDDVPLSMTLTAKDVADWDSFKQLEILIASEQRFGLKFKSSEVVRLQTLGDLVRIVASRGSL